MIEGFWGKVAQISNPGKPKTTKNIPSKATDGWTKIHDLTH
jgi:hypothetical protein